MKNNKYDINYVIAGDAGQGTQSFIPMFVQIPPRITNDTNIMGDNTQVSLMNYTQTFSYDFQNISEEIRKKMLINIFTVGLLASLFHIPNEKFDLDRIKEIMKSFFKKYRRIINYGIT